VTSCDSIGARHLDVHQESVEARVDHPLDRGLSAVDGNGDMPHGPEKVTQNGRDQLIIVRNQEIEPALG
jgi:hypothetical protein